MVMWGGIKARVVWGNEEERVVNLLVVVACLQDNLNHECEESVAGVFSRSTESHFIFSSSKQGNKDSEDHMDLGSSKLKQYEVGTNMKLSNLKLNSANRDVVHCDLEATVNDIHTERESALILSSEEILLSNRCTSVAWIPERDGAFVAAHADGNLYSKDGPGDSTFPVIKDQTQFSVAHARSSKVRGSPIVPKNEAKYPLTEEPSVFSAAIVHKLLHLKEVTIAILEMLEIPSIS
ncbi:WD40/YVTN repeat-like-containing domain-containing protein [Artemisia annua]|uniref:WD40/YVTN repeat-like-containing domain-containing protein n=1 Tax=Artemisia annua TaxID=35608 RepID=A0A2U1N9H7_ARTAN|nr:WD40/YVTN repeat-like-containing domain-containing protein [Artemisia annua]